jgi:transposase
MHQRVLGPGSLQIHTAVRSASASSPCTKTSTSRLRQGVPAAPVIHTDDTGWRVGGRTAFLMGFDTDQATVYQIRDRHRNEEVREVIGDGYGGVLVSDRGKSYEAEEFAEMEQQKCLAHLLRNISEVVETKRGRARQFGTELKTVLREGLDLWHVRDDLSSEEFPYPGLGTRSAVDIPSPRPRSARLG